MMRRLLIPPENRKCRCGIGLGGYQKCQAEWPEDQNGVSADLRTQLIEDHESNQRIENENPWSCARGYDVLEARGRPRKSQPVQCSSVSRFSDEESEMLHATNPKPTMPSQLSQLNN
jgi:hypothetical protein